MVAHSGLVYDVAVALVDTFGGQFPELAVDREALLFGAATHDIGKVRHPEELTRPGHAHEAAGHAFVRAAGIDARLARFARDHASWTKPGLGVEDLLVSLADKVWKGAREESLEGLVIASLAAATGLEAWEAFLALDDIVGPLAKGADARLAYQSSFGV